MLQGDWWRSSQSKFLDFFTSMLMHLIVQRRLCFDCQFALNLFSFETDFMQMSHFDSENKALMLGYFSFFLLVATFVMI